MKVVQIKMTDVQMFLIKEALIGYKEEIKDEYKESIQFMIDYFDMVAKDLEDE